ncbi:MAG: GTP-binding protein, partial [Peptococcaceae bacterium]|nr:GTP-binding protein [Peptococcaceae bacterium]
GEHCTCGHDHHREHHHEHGEHCTCGHDHHHEHHHEHGEHCTCGHNHHHEHHHHADEVFVSWGMETPAVYTKERVESILNALGQEETFGLVLRAKGMLPAEDNTWIYFDYVPEETEIRGGKPAVTGKICVIGSGLKQDALEALFKA